MLRCNFKREHKPDSLVLHSVTDNCHTISGVQVTHSQYFAFHGWFAFLSLRKITWIQNHIPASSCEILLQPQEDST